jgi:(p)ppGpp synthase/HD superfamily hydrolase
MKKQKVRQPIPIVEYALYIALKGHEGQTRKDSAKTPYIVHPVSVALIVSRYTDSNDVLAAALLHDILEDTNYTAEQLRREFGNRVLRLVREVSEPRGEMSWAMRKEAYLDSLAQVSHPALIIAAADKITNLRAMRSAYLVDGEQLWQRFAPQSTREQRLEFYRRVYHRVAIAWPHCPLLEELRHDFNKTITAIEKQPKLLRRA